MLSQGDPDNGISIALIQRHKKYQEIYKTFMIYSKEFIFSRGLVHGNLYYWGLFKRDINFMLKAKLAPNSTVLTSKAPERNFELFLQKLRDF